MAWPKVAKLVRSPGCTSRPPGRARESSSSTDRAARAGRCNDRSPSATRSSCRPEAAIRPIHRSSGYDLEEQAKELLEILEPEDHLVGHSYGGVILLLAAAEAGPSSLTVLEPPAFGVARGQPAVDRLIEESSSTS